ncbi:transporting ATPase [Idiomarina tyrosinivorans]|uniref:Transporting ATPase n=1 Tax=Idiomarina tyrosinivorans TaxID=1445662 RepID=A0A432ZRL0_9GAMM|nr:elongation factor P hydroxylase [Idiomarina tyrosinivorans]RUO80513.1 transporting ATPase [Idiomarina tyrosinivorans]
MDYQPLIDCFAECFADSHRTLLVAGDGEPYYQPAAAANDFHRIYFAHGFFNSALHEVAHWCIAGTERRMLPDYGYWYEPDGRNQQQQLAFEQVESRPQALECWFCYCTGSEFTISIDNLSGVPVDPSAFRHKVEQQWMQLGQHGLPARAEVFARALCCRFNQPWPDPNHQPFRSLL